jgi:hypothetical protein
MGGNSSSSISLAGLLLISHRSYLVIPFSLHDRTDFAHTLFSIPSLENIPNQISSSIFFAGLHCFCTDLIWYSISGKYISADRIISQIGTILQF